MINIRSKREIDLLKEAGQIAALAHQEVSQYIKANVSTATLNEVIAKVIKSHQAVATFLGYNKYPYASCISVNEVMVHGFPSKKIILKEGDLVSIDIGVTKNGYIGDMARTYIVGTGDEVAKALVACAIACLDEALKLVKANVHLGDIEHQIEQTAHQFGFTVTHDYGGHGVGTKLHEDPFIHLYGQKGTGVLLKEGMVLAIEPMVLEHQNATYVDQDGWTVRSKDGGRCAHHEDTIVVTQDGYEILTKIKED